MAVIARRSPDKAVPRHDLRRRFLWLSCGLLASGPVWCTPPPPRTVESAAPGQPDRLGGLVCAAAANERRCFRWTPAMSR